MLARGCDGAYGGLWRSLESGGRFCVGVFGRNLASVAFKMFSHSVFFIKKFYKCTFNAICRDNAAVDRIAFQDSKVLFPWSMSGYNMLLLYYCLNVALAFVKCTNTRHVILTALCNYTLPYKNFTSPAINTVHAKSTSVARSYLASFLLWGPLSIEYTARWMGLLRHKIPLPHSSFWYAQWMNRDLEKTAEIRIMYKETKQEGKE
jgi:hypothetical protein